jgi:hypothetical protein
MPKYVPFGETEIANKALREIGSAPINSIDDTNSASAIACAGEIWQSVREVGRLHNWNCLRRRQTLTQLSFPQSSSSGSGTAFGWPGCRPSVPPPYWLPNTLYSGGTLVTYGEAIYYCMAPSGPALSSSNFINDLTAGMWAQLYSSFFAGNYGNTGGLYEWRFGYALPTDYLLIEEMNGNDCRFGRGRGSLYELFINEVVNTEDQSVTNQGAIFCDKPWADIKYTAFIQDPTIFDPLFITCVAVKLAANIATQILGDGGKMSTQLNNRFETETLTSAMLKDSGEHKAHRYDPTRESQFLRSRRGSTAG